MVYLEYEEAKRKYQRAVNNLNELTDKKELLFLKTQPKGISYDKDKVQGSGDGNVLESYVISLEELEPKIKYARRLVNDRQRVLELAKINLTKSEEIDDVIYVKRYFERKKVRKISLEISYSEVQIYRILGQIRRSREK
ncbi:MAG: hypothetical protein E7242_05890 [Lachnospiraceae bacterium]|nr:hypothetical protein [Lachnospiraceae bacterium]